MGILLREPEKASGKTYDLIIVGGGIYGVMLSLEASLRGMRSLLLERNDFGEFTTFNSLRIIHGGFRYLQTLDFHRMKESFQEQRFFLRNFPDLVKPLPCFMPLYGEGLRRPFILKAALFLYDALCQGRNEGVRPDVLLSPGYTVNRTQTKQIFPSVDLEGLKGGAVWHDAFVLNPQRLLIEILRFSAEHGATVLNYVEGDKLLLTKNKVRGIRAIDQETGDVHEYNTNIVINSCGPWCRELAARFDRDEPDLFRSTMAWNILLDKKPISEYALAVSPKKRQGHTYFLVPWNGKILAGTGHSPWPGNEKKPALSHADIQTYLDELNLAAPTLEARQRDIIRILPGLQPAKKEGGTDLADREVIVDHSGHGGPTGFYSISGVKFTTARRVAEKILSRIFPDSGANKHHGENSFRQIQDSPFGTGTFDFDWYPNSGDSTWEETLESIIKEESVLHLDDLIFRRTTLWGNPSRTQKIAPLLCHFFPWNDSRKDDELKRLNNQIYNGIIS